MQFTRGSYFKEDRLVVNSVIIYLAIWERIHLQQNLTDLNKIGAVIVLECEKLFASSNYTTPEESGLSPKMYFATK